MPRLRVAVRAVAAVVALGAGTTAGIAAAAVHGKSHTHAKKRHGRKHLARPALVPVDVLDALKLDVRRRHQPNPTPTTTTPTTTTPTTTTPTTSTPTPTGVGGNWNLVFDDEFNGTSLNTNVWNNHDGWTNQNSVTDHAGNITEAGGDLTLTLASGLSGAEIGTNQNVLAVGDFAEARVYFAGSGTTIYNWPAWWASGPNWPTAGENDIAEGLGTLTVNYHSPSGAHNTGTVSGIWANAFHTYGIYRGSNYCDVYYDGQLVRQYATADNGAAEELLFTMGAANALQFGADGEMQVDYVRVWAPA